jgi:AhpD family alkylhydroperoxidase
MSERKPPKISPEGAKVLGAVNDYVLRSGLEKPLIDLTFLRASQINGCAFCVDMHARDLISGGVSVEKALLVSAWREAGAYFDYRERAALAWTETVTLVAQSKVPDADLEAAQAAFTDKELADLTLAIGLINTYNRIGVALRRPPASLARLQAGERA